MLGHQKLIEYPGRVGLDIGHHTVSGVEVVERASESVIRSAGSVPISGIRSKQDLPDPSAVIQAIKGLWAFAGLESRRVVLALPPSAVYLKWLHIEASDDDELEQTAHATASRGAPFASSDAIVDYRVLSERNVGSRKIYFTLLVAASGSVVDEMLTAAESAGLEPLAVDIGVLAALRSVGSQKTASALWSGQPKAHCTMGAKHTTIAVIRENAPEFARTVPVGGNDFTERIVEHTGASWAEAERIKLTPGVRLNDECMLVAPSPNGELRVPCEQVVGRLAREIQRSLRFFKSQYAEGSYLGMVGATTASGGGVLLKGLDYCLQEHGIEIKGIFNPFAGYSVAAEKGGVHGIGDSATMYTTAMGLAMADYWQKSKSEELRVAV